MELTSEPAFTEEHVQDIDIAFASGVVPLTLYDGDTFDDLDHGFKVTYKNGEVCFFNGAQILWYSTRNRIIRKPVTGSERTQSQTSQGPTLPSV